MLSLFAAIINKLKQRMVVEVPKIFEAVFQVTLQMITKNFEVGSDMCIQRLPDSFKGKILGCTCPTLLCANLTCAFVTRAFGQHETKAFELNCIQHRLLLVLMNPVMTCHVGLIGHACGWICICRTILIEFSNCTYLSTHMLGVCLQDYPEHRLQFFSLLRAITNHCFDTLFTMSPDQLKLVIDSIVWAFRHTERNIAETGALHCWPALVTMCACHCLAG